MTEKELSVYGEKIRKKNKERNIKGFILSVIVVFCLFIGYLYLKKGYIPIVHKTKVIKAKVILIKKYNFGKGLQKFRIRYEFNDGNKTYQGGYNKWRKDIKEGDFIYIKYKVSNPSINEVE